MVNTWGRLISVFVFLMFLSFSSSVRADEETGWWRVDADTMAGIYSGQLDREGDIYCLIDAAYEFPVCTCGTLAFELAPVFSYFGRYDEVTGAGFGFDYRIYREPDYTGWFAGAGTIVMFHNPKFIGNSSSMNFVSSLALGHMGRCGWQASCKISHISNADTGHDNAGLNFAGLSIGRRF